MAITISGQNNNDRILASDGVLDSISGFNVVGVMTAAQFDVTGKTTTNHLNIGSCLLYTSPSPRDRTRSRMPSSA